MLAQTPGDRVAHPRLRIMKKPGTGAGIERKMRPAQGGSTGGETSGSNFRRNHLGSKPKANVGSRSRLMHHFLAPQANQRPATLCGDSKLVVPSVVHGYCGQKTESMRGFCGFDPPRPYGELRPA